jgi:hypothetical protein
VYLNEYSNVLELPLKHLTREALFFYFFVVRITLKTFKGNSNTFEYSFKYTNRDVLIGSEFLSFQMLSIT